MKAIEYTLNVDDVWTLTLEYPVEQIGHGEAVRIQFDDDSSLLTPDPSTLLPPHPKPIEE